MSSDNPRYRRYRGRPGGAPAPEADPLRELRQLRRDEAAAPPGTAPGGGRPDGGRAPVTPRRRIKPPRSFGKKLVRWALVGASAWIALSLVVFLISAQIHQADVGGADALLGGGGTPPVGASTVLVIGSDRRPDDTQEPGARTTGYGLADSIMLMRVGGGSGSKLSIARDTIVPIPGHGTGKINSAYAFGGPELLVQTVEQYTGLDIHHVMQIGFSDFAPLIDSMGGITYRGSCVIAKVNGGYANGGVTLRIRSGEKVHLNGRQALALARTRKNACNDAENDLTRARRQQRVIGSMKRRALSPIGFARLPLIAWHVPKTLDSDMAGPRLLGTMAGLALSSGGKTNVLGTTSGYVPDEVRERAVSKFLGN